MINDKQLIMSEDQALTSVGSAASTNVIDLGPLALGRGPLSATLLEAYCVVTAAFAATGAATLQAVLQMDTASSFGSPTTILDTGAIGKATLVAGYKMFHVRLPVNCERYIRVNYTVATDDMTAGTVFAAVVIEGDTPNIPIA